MPHLKLNSYLWAIESTRQKKVPDKFKKMWRRFYCKKQVLFLLEHNFSIQGSLSFDLSYAKVFLSVFPLKDKELLASVIRIVQKLEMSWVVVCDINCRCSACPALTTLWLCREHRSSATWRRQSSIRLILNIAFILPDAICFLTGENGQCNYCHIGVRGNCWDLIFSAGFILFNGFES